jgi:xylulokinase
LGSLDPGQRIVDQLEKAFSHPYSPNWQDASTQSQCDSFDVELGSPEKLADATGSSAHHVCHASLYLERLY